MSEKKPNSDRRQGHRGFGWRTRTVQAVACALVSWYAWDDTRNQVEPALQLGPGLFVPKDPVALLSAEISAVTQAPGVSTEQIRIQRNDTLDRIFRKLKLSLSDLAEIRGLQGAQALLDRLNTGEVLQLSHRDDELVGLERRLSLTEKLFITRQPEGFRADRVPLAVQRQRALTHGVIDSSLFEDAGKAGLSDPTVLELSRIFGWDIDFVQDLRDGDAFTVYYERLYQNGQYAEDGDILAARFVNQGRTYEAVRYTAADGSSRYYTPAGRSMQKAFLRAPLDFRRVSSGFSLARFHPILNRIRAHQGVDYAAPIGTPVRASGAGRVRSRGWKGGYGNELELDHGAGIITVYGHLSRFAAGLAVGQHVEQGQVIAYVGMTGLATGPHLHYEFRLNGVYQDPQKVKLPDATPIDPSLLADFEHQSAPLLAALSRPPEGAN